jgi:hypothetical protein
MEPEQYWIKCNKPNRHPNVQVLLSPRTCIYFSGYIFLDTDYILKSFEDFSPQRNQTVNNRSSEWVGWSVDSALFGRPAGRCLADQQRAVWPVDSALFGRSALSLQNQFIHVQSDLQIHLTFVLTFNSDGL